MHRFKNPVYLSNEELVEEMRGIRNPTHSKKELFRKNQILDEIRRRLDEVWRKLKEPQATIKK